MHFRTWSVEDGPTEWDDRDVWDELDAYLNKNDVSAAASLLRRYLEHFAAEACDHLRAPVEFRGDARFELGDILPAASSALSDGFKKAKAAANSWKQQAVIDEIALREQAFIKARTDTHMDQWQLNAAVHFNAWAAFHKNDFVPVAKAFREFVGLFRCPTCQTPYKVIPPRGKKTGLRCECGATNMNLTAKG